MNTACKTLASAAVLTLLSACASDGTALVQQHSDPAYDYEYIATVEHIANHAPERVRVQRDLTRATSLDNIFANNPDVIARLGGPDAVRANPALLDGQTLTIRRSDGSVEKMPEGAVYPLIP